MLNRRSFFFFSFEEAGGRLNVIITVCDRLFPKYWDEKSAVFYWSLCSFVSQQSQPSQLCPVFNSISSQWQTNQAPRVSVEANQEAGRSLSSTPQYLPIFGICNITTQEILYSSVRLKYRNTVNALLLLKGGWKWISNKTRPDRPKRLVFWGFNGHPMRTFRYTGH